MVTTKKYIDLTGLGYFWEQATKQIQNTLIAHGAVQDGVGEVISEKYLTKGDAETTYLSQTNWEGTEAYKFVSGDKNTYDTAVTNINANKINNLSVTAPTSSDQLGATIPTAEQILTKLGKDYTLDLSSFAVKNWVEKYVQHEVDAAKAQHLKIQIVDEGGLEGIDPPDLLTIYLVPGTPGGGSYGSGNESNSYIEYIYTGTKFEKIGTTEADWTNYYTKSAVDDKIQKIAGPSEDGNDGLIGGVNTRIGTLEGTVDTNKSDIAKLKVQDTTHTQDIASNTEAITAEKTAREASDSKYDAILNGFKAGTEVAEVKTYIDVQITNVKSDQATVDTEQNSRIKTLEDTVGISGEAAGTGLSERVETLETKTTNLETLTTGDFTVTSSPGTTTNTIKGYIDSEVGKVKSSVTTEAQDREAADTGLTDAIAANTKAIASIGSVENGTNGEPETISSIFKKV